MAKAKGTTAAETAAETEAAQTEAEVMTAEATAVGAEAPVQSTETAAAEPTEAEATATEATAEEQETKTSPAGKAAAEKEESFVYIGPSLPEGKLKKNTVLQGTKSAIMKALAPVLDEYPKVKRMLVPVGSLADSRVRIRNGGNVLRRTYDELAAGKAAEKEVTGNE